MRRQMRAAFSGGLRAGSGVTGYDDGQQGSGHGPPETSRDLKKLTLIIGLGLLSWAATYIGMMELIEANLGGLSIVHRLVIGFSVAMLMIMIIWLLDQMFAPIPGFTKLCYAMGYVFLTIVSVGFGFGFYWKVLESRAEASRSAESAVSQIQTSLHGAAARLDQLQGTLVKLAEVSSEKAELERTKGTSCPNSRPGDGPRRKMRDEDAARFSFASEFVKGRSEAVKAELGRLDADLALIAGNDASTIDAKSGTRNEFMKSLGRKLDMTAAGFNAFRTDPQLRQLRTELADRADRSTFGDPKKGGFVCPDPQLQGALRGAVRAIDQLPELESPKIAAVEGSEATIEAFRRLTATFYGLLSFKLPPSADELRQLQQKAVQSLEDDGATARRLAADQAVGLSKRDYVPLAIAIFVDLCLLLVAMGRPVNRLGGLLPKMRDAEQSPVNQILARFSDIHRDAEIRQTFEVFRHVVFDQAGVYYVAVPLDTPYRANPRNPDQRYGYGAGEAQELQVEAHLLANLFTSFEKERIFTRVYSPLLTTRTIQRKLARQGSKFAGCAAFRLYRFRDGAWPEIILGAVMGAARRAEEVERTMRTQAPRSAETGTPTERTREPQVSADRPGIPPLVHPSMHPEREPASRPMRRRARLQAVPTASPADPHTVARYGPYARSVEVERLAVASVKGPVAPANSNTMPSSAPGRMHASGRDVPTAHMPTIVPLPVRGRETRQAQEQVQEADHALDTGLQHSAADATWADGLESPAALAHRVTLSIPVTHATLPVSLLQGEDGDAHHGPPKASASAELGLPHGDQPSPTDLKLAPEPADLTEEIEIMELAGRLRPALPAE